MIKDCKVWIAAIVCVVLSTVSAADELIVSAGGGRQVNSDQENKTASLDYAFYELRRSKRQTLSVGVSYTYLESNFGSDDGIYAISIYPQLTLFPSAASWISRRVPDATTPFFFVRALGPTYMSETRFGEREQSAHFTFQAQVGVGLHFKTRSGRKHSLSISWKHFSNGNLYADNDGYDFPFVVGFGARF